MGICDPGRERGWAGCAPGRVKWVPDKQPGLSGAMAPRSDRPFQELLLQAWASDPGWSFWAPTLGESILRCNLLDFG